MFYKSESANEQIWSGYGCRSHNYKTDSNTLQLTIRDVAKPNLIDDLADTWQGWFCILSAVTIQVFPQVVFLQN